MRLSKVQVDSIQIEWLFIGPKVFWVHYDLTYILSMYGNISKYIIIEN